MALLRTGTRLKARLNHALGPRGIELASHSPCLTFGYSRGWFTAWSYTTMKLVA